MAARTVVRAEPSPNTQVKRAREQVGRNEGWKVGVGWGGVGVPPPLINLPTQSRRGEAGKGEGVCVEGGGGGEGWGGGGEGENY